LGSLESLSPVPPLPQGEDRGEGEVNPRLAKTANVETLPAIKRAFFLGLLLGVCAFAPLAAPGAEARGSATRGYDLLARSNLVAWCIVPFDARKRGPEDRAAMLEKLGFK